MIIGVITSTLSYVITTKVVSSIPLVARRTR